MKNIACLCRRLLNDTMMESMKKVVKESKSLDEKDYPMEAIGVDKLERYINDYDVILVGPQLSHKYDFIKGSR